jgi:DNA end-binding protein Ku
MTMRGKENLIAVKPCGHGLLLETLRYSGELRKSDKIFSDIPNKRPAKDMIELATELIERKSGPFKPEAFKDHYGEALKALVAEKRKKGKIIEAEADEAERPQGDNVIDLMEALKKSVTGKADSAAKPRQRKAARKKARR